ncbi:MAG: PilZ domain-containing protein [Planctomycetota bacterium]
MLEKAQRIYVQHPTRKDNLIPAAVVEVKEHRARVRFLQPVALPAKKRTRLFFHDQHQAFYSIACEVVRMESLGPQPVGSISLIGEPQRDDQRQTLRVQVHGDEVSARIDNVGDGRVLNLSCTGLAVSLDSDGLAIDTWVTLAIGYDGQPITGRMQVRNWSKLTDGRVRYGLVADPCDGQLLSELSRITQNQQQIEAGRASGFGGNLRYSAGENPQSIESNAAEESSAVDQPAAKETGGRSKRQHDRRPWTGAAKIYLRESQNLRVLDVKTIDLSPGGLSFECPKYIYEDSELLFEKPIPGGMFRIRGEVRSVHVDQSGKHRVGIKFLGIPLQPNESVPELETLAASG